MQFRQTRCAKYKTDMNKYTKLLKEQLNTYTDENRVLEFKSNYQDVDRLGKYISALSNGACLDNEEMGYLWFGVDDTTHEVKGTKFDYIHEKAVGNQDLELYLRRMISPKINFTIEEFLYDGMTRVVVLLIPAAAGEPTTYQGKPYIRVNSQTTELTPYTDWLRTIYNSQVDWSAQAIEGALLDWLDPEAVRLARAGYKQRYPEFADECDRWDDRVFLDRAKLTANGRINRTTLLLLGKDEYQHHLGHIAQIVWKLNTGDELAGDIYSTPFLLATNRLLGRIRNYRFKIYPHNTLIPHELWKYDTKSILEALNNCIAHQDYLRNSRIIVTETREELIFRNAGRFFAGSYEQYISGNTTPTNYRNPFLVRAMVNIKMIDTQGMGIHNIFLSQRNRSLPMPYYVNTLNDTEMHMPGTVIDENYSLMLIERKDLTLEETVLLDKVQRHEAISDEATAILRKKKLVEGRKNFLMVSKEVAQATEQKAQYTKNRGLDDAYYKDLIVAALEQHERLSRPEINELLLSKLPEALSEQQKLNKINSLLTALRRTRRIKVGKNKLWELY